MEMFIDEAGQFTPSSGWSAVCCLSLPHKEAGPARRRLAFASRDWPRAANGELKGGSLDLVHLQKLVEILLDHDALLHASVIDVASESDVGLRQHKSRQAELVTAQLTPDHHQNVIAAAHDLKSMLDRMPMQLYLQSVAMRDLVSSVVQDVTLYFSQRRPRELGLINWTIDAKDPVRVTTQEEWWKKTLGPFLESNSKRYPLTMLNDKSADYTYFEREFVPGVKPRCSDSGPRELEGYDIRKLVVDHLNFVDSRSDIMIQAVDILVNFLRRTLMGRIVDLEVARTLGRLQIRRKFSGGIVQSIHIISLSNDDGFLQNSQIGTMIEAMALAGRPMLRKPIRSRSTRP